MLPRLRTARSICIGIARISVAAMLAVVLLSGLIPSGAISALHTCKTACCAGKPTHEAGACSAFPASAETSETPPQADTSHAGEHSSHHGEMRMSSTTTETVNETITETTVSSGHCQTSNHSSAQPHVPRRDSSKHSSVAARAFTRPCAAECAAAILTLTQVRRPREAATLSIAVRPRPPTLISRAGDINNLSTSSTERRRRIRPRAPPASLVNLSA